MTEEMRFKRGLLPPRENAVKLKFSMYAKPSFPKRPDEFGDPDLMPDWFLLGNSKFGNCFWAGAAHETFAWSGRLGQRVHITTKDVLSDYSDATGFNPSDPSTDAGTDMAQGAAYRRKVGILDSSGNRHKVAAYVALKPGNLEEMLNAAWLFGAASLGVTIGRNQEEQFSRGLPWDGDPGANAGGHAVPLIADKGGKLFIITWGKKQEVTPAFLENYCDQALCYLSPDMLKNGKSLDGFDLAALQSDLNLLTA